MVMLISWPSFMLVLMSRLSTLAHLCLCISSVMRADAQVRTLMTRKSCAEGMYNATLRNYLKSSVTLAKFGIWRKMIKDFLER